ncbi:hypothetical protein N7533_009209 [Penicillium manginii]|uniref:uncharacterized protein n=1 Tax=Penicillium manginii TaxID=203109 RepID=UPI0025495B3A|nr:uncharacterized protein N7533_009209 [Penicillium manginii]KAJ5744339.1 hypothetical protein N7533_009209 [Penicillium manginii]
MFPFEVLIEIMLASEARLTLGAMEWPHAACPVDEKETVNNRDSGCTCRKFTKVQQAGIVDNEPKLTRETDNMLGESEPNGPID